MGSGNNFGIEKSKGEYLCFLDSDDWWQYEKLESINQSTRTNSDANKLAEEIKEALLEASKNVN